MIFGRLQEQRKIASVSQGLLGRRRFLRLSWGLVLLPFVLPGRPARAAARSRKVPYTVDVGFLHGALQFHLAGMSNEVVDPAAGRYDVTLAGEGNGISHRIQSTGALIQGRWAPREANSRFSVLGRESRTEIVYDWTRRRVDYHFRGETFFLRRLRMADDVLAIPESMHVDDLISAALNYADARWPAQAEGSLRTHVVRRKKPDDEGPDDVLQSYGAELSPLVLTFEAGQGSGKRSALIDFTRFSAWARRDQPVEVTFGNDGQLAAVHVPMILGSSVKVAFGNEDPLRRGTDLPGFSVRSCNSSRMGLDRTRSSCSAMILCSAASPRPPGNTSAGTRIWVSKTTLTAQGIARDLPR